MAKIEDKTAEAVEATPIASGIIDFVEPAKANKYTDTVKALIEAGEGKAYRLVVPTSETRGEGDKARTVNVAQAEKLEFQGAANELGKTARIVGEPVQDVDANTTAYVFVLKAKYNKPKLGPRGAKPAADVTEVAPDAAE